jgi:CubicO group peptidase (beta-lactamase class C family)
MKRGAKIGLWVGAFLFVGLLAAVYWLLANTMPIGTGHAAKTICSNVFISQRDPQQVFTEDIAPVHMLFAPIRFSVDRDEKSVTSTALGIFKTKAVFRPGCGCTVVKKTTEPDLRSQKFMQTGPRMRDHRANHLPWPRGNSGPVSPLPAGVDTEKLKVALDAAFAEADADNLRKTRAVVVVYDGQLIAERYASGFDAAMPLLGWSMSKSVTNALVGILVKAGKLELQAPAPVDEWPPGDPRAKITLDQLLRMSGGLAFNEAYAPFSDAVSMFYDSYDFAAYAAAKPLEAEPGTQWHYSSGTANIVARIVRRAAETVDPNYFVFLYRELFDKIGMHSAVFEPDPSGTFVGSSYVFATARDWARFGLLYLQDGMWSGEQILPKDWVSYTTTPTPGAPKGEYGALFWLNAGAPDNTDDCRWPRAPRDAFFATGFQEQKVIVIPSRKVVLVRLGNTTVRSAWSDEDFITHVLAALPDEKT